ncbi:MAG: hypothetical protein L3K16_08880 [Thermoplasmata archaeon]|nr:hypothetical protein [Thermoplasmata archaeon]
MPRSARLVPLVVVLAVVLTAGTATAGPSAALTVGTNGAITVALSVADPNGSALRYAMDGNFSPLVDALPGNASSHAELLAGIEVAESNPLFSGLFGNHDGTVEPAEVGMFESLLESEVGTVPTATLTGDGLLNMTLNGVPPGSATFDSVGFSGAPGPDSSSAPITATTSTTEQFLPTGTSGTVGIAWNLSLGSVGLGLAIPGPNASVTVTTPAGTTITSTSGFQSAAVSNDLLGYSAPTASGSLGTHPTGSASVTFHPAFPLGDVLIVVAVGVVAAVGGVLWWRRHRRSPPGAPDAPRS